MRVLAIFEIWFGIDYSLDIFELSWLSFSSNSSDLSTDVCGECRPLLFIVHKILCCLNFFFVAFLVVTAGGHVVQYNTACK